LGNTNDKILVHICCAACFSYLHKVLSAEDYNIVGIFYNPQTHGKAEYLRRLYGVESFCKKNNIELIVPEYNVQEFFKPILPMQDKNSIKYIGDKKRWRTKRCQKCYSLILTQLMSFALDNDIKIITTSLLVTPYKDHDEIWNIGLELERENDVRFYYKDFRKGYWSGRNYARSHKMCIPSYCGCVYSSEEGILE